MTACDAQIRIPAGFGVYKCPLLPAQKRDFRPKYVLIALIFYHKSNVHLFNAQNIHFCKPRVYVLPYCDSFAWNRRQMRAKIMKTWTNGV